MDQNKVNKDDYLIRQNILCGWIGSVPRVKRHHQCQYKTLVKWIECYNLNAGGVGVNDEILLYPVSSWRCQFDI